MTTHTIPYYHPIATGIVMHFVVGLTSAGWRAFTREGERIEGCHGKTFDSVVNAVRDRYPGALLYAIALPDGLGGTA